MALISYTIVYIHSALALYLAQRFSDGNRGSKYLPYLVAVFNASLSPFFLQTLSEGQVAAYVLILALFILEVRLLFKCSLLANLAISVIIMFHFYSFRAITLSGVSLYYETSIQSIINNTILHWHTAILTMIVHIIIILAVIVIFKPKYIKAILSNKVLLSSIFTIIFLVTVFSVYNSSIFILEDYSKLLITHQIVITIIFMLLFYMVLLFMLRLVTLDTYKDLIKELEKKIDSNNMLFESVFKFSDIVVEYNVTNDFVRRAVVESSEMSIPNNIKLHDFVRDNFHFEIKEEDAEKIKKIDSQYLIKSFEESNRELTLDFKAKKIVLKDNKGVNLDLNSIDEYLWYRMNVYILSDPTSSDIVSIIATDEITDEKEKEQALVSRAELDALTGAYNKNAMSSKINDLLETNETGALFVIDIDNFKSINDGIGHSYGDKVLVEIYEELKRVFRDQDIIGRFGGDEFVAFISNQADESNIVSIATRICESIRKTHTSESGIAVDISTSVGISISPIHGNSYLDLFDAADKALYKSKNRGKNTFTIHKK